MGYQYILFDFDGTIANTGEGIVKSVDYALRSFGIRTENQAELIKFIGPPLRESFRIFYGMDAAQAERAVAKYRERYSDRGIWENELYPGVEKLLQQLKQAGKTVALATSKPGVYAKMVLKQHQIEPYFDVIVGSELDGTRERKTEVIAEVLRQLAIGAEERERAVMIGDRHQDMLGAKEFGLATIGLRLGFAAPRELEDCRPDAIADDYAALDKLLLGS